MQYYIPELDEKIDIISGKAKVNAEYISSTNFKVKDKEYSVIFRKSSLEKNFLVLMKNNGELCGEYYRIHDHTFNLLDLDTPNFLKVFLEFMKFLNGLNNLFVYVPVKSLIDDKIPIPNHNIISIDDLYDNTYEVADTMFTTFSFDGIEHYAIMRKNKSFCTNVIFYKIGSKDPQAVYTGLRFNKNTFEDCIKDFIVVSNKVFERSCYM